MNAQTLCKAVREIVRRKRVVEGEFVELREDAATNRCKPLLLRSNCAFWALRLEANDHLPFLEELRKDQSVTRLPDYLVFSEPPAGAQNECVRVVIGEMKSSEAGVSSAKRQVQLGKVLAEHLLRLARLQMGEPERSLKDSLRAPVANFAGIIVSTDLPMNIMPKGGTRPGKTVHLPSAFDELCRMHVFHTQGGGELHLDQLFR